MRSSPYWADKDTAAAMKWTEQLPDAAERDAGHSGHPQYPRQSESELH